MTYTIIGEFSYLVSDLREFLRLPELGSSVKLREAFVNLMSIRIELVHAMPT